MYRRHEAVKTSILIRRAFGLHRLGPSAALRRTSPGAAELTAAPRNEAGLLLQYLANPEIIEFDGREISAATSCLRRLRPQRRNGATDDEDHHNYCPSLCLRASIITVVAVHKLLLVECHTRT